MDFQISKSDLQFKYSWTTTPGDDPKLRGEPDSNLFNRGEGYEVLYLINKLLKKRSLSSKSDAQKLEKMIKDDLPGDVRSQEKVMAWLENNF